MRGLPEAALFVSSVGLAYVGTSFGLEAGAAQQWMALAFYVIATAGCGTFFTWTVGRLDKLRAHEHRQNNAMAVLTLLNEQHADDLAEIRHALRIPRP